MPVPGIDIDTTAGRTDCVLRFACHVSNLKSKMIAPRSTAKISSQSLITARTCLMTATLRLDKRPTGVLKCVPCGLRQTLQSGLTVAVAHCTSIRYQHLSTREAGLTEVVWLAE